MLTQLKVKLQRFNYFVGTLSLRQNITHPLENELLDECFKKRGKIFQNQLLSIVMTLQVILGERGVAVTGMT